MTSVVTQHEARDGRRLYQPWCAECLLSGPATEVLERAQVNANLHNTDHHGAQS